MINAGNKGVFIRGKIVLAGHLCAGLWQAGPWVGQLAKHAGVNHMQLIESGHKGAGWKPFVLAGKQGKS